MTALQFRVQALEPLAKLVVDESLKNKLSKTLGVLISAYLAILEIPSFASGSLACALPNDAQSRLFTAFLA